MREWVSITYAYMLNHINTWFVADVAAAQNNCFQTKIMNYHFFVPDRAYTHQPHIYVYAFSKINSCGWLIYVHNRLSTCSQRTYSIKVSFFNSFNNKKIKITTQYSIYLLWNEINWWNARDYFRKVYKRALAWN